MIEMLYFRDSDKILKKKQMLNDVQVTMEYVGDALTGALYMLLR
jgi:hypothetical protein